MSCSTRAAAIWNSSSKRNATQCVISGLRYQLRSDLVEWHINIRSGQSCVGGLRFNNVANPTIGLISPPRFGQVTLLGPGFSYTARSDYGGEDFFVVGVWGTISGVIGASIVRIVISVIGPRQAPKPIVPASLVSRSPRPA